jgi:GNAT superfamily N-acetyltransferase
MQLRDAEPDDLRGIYDVWYATEIDGVEPPPRWEDGPGTMPWFDHLLAIGRLMVAVDDGAVVGFAGLLDHGRCVALSDLFVHPSQQSKGIGGALLDAILPPDRPRVTMASADPRAVASYARRGMRPRWPAYYVTAEPAQLRSAPRLAVNVREIPFTDYDWDLPGDAEHYTRLHAITLAVEQAGRRLGTALVMTGNPQRLFHPQATELLESAATTEDDAAALVLGLVAHLLDQGASRVVLQVPGPHAALAPLLKIGFLITDADMACATDADLFAAPTRYTMHGEARVTTG